MIPNFKPYAKSDVQRAKDPFRILRSTLGSMSKNLYFTCDLN